MSIKRILYSLLVGILLALVGLAGYGYFLLDDKLLGTTAGDENTSGQVARGAYLARAGNCMGCHTMRGGDAYAGGRLIQSEFGNFLTPNITADVNYGIGAWSAEDFWQALHNGKSKDGRMLYPAFPFTNYSQITRTDGDALFAYFKTVKPVARENQPHDLRFPYSQRILLAFWRALYFRPAVYQNNTQQTAEWNRGAYLVNGLAHCSACHSSRNVLGANGGTHDLSGGALPMVNWYAPSLLAQEEAGLLHWQPVQLQALLKTGVSQQAVASGPMAEVVAGSLQYLTATDIAAMGTYLQALPVSKTAAADMLDKALLAPSLGKEQMAMLMQQGASLYKTHCADCHGVNGAGGASIYPALAGNPAVQMQNVANPLRIILAGGFAPATEANPRPYGMPPFGPVLSDAEVAIVLSYVRNAWANQGSVITAAEVNRYRTAPLD
ncbi:c-type cytochrome [Undibacterium sp. Ren11W]|uniref:c-type cytochrome n=1 Tax=Undibacterium sp. Ren11W TaxID=3413045 RepID=UPI003BF1D912